MSKWAIYLDRCGLGPDGKRAFLRDKQGGLCGICGTGGRALVHDHDHRTGRLRGLLCRPCNFREGAYQSRLIQPTGDVTAIAAYLAAPPAGMEMLWDLPDWWRPQHTHRMRAEQVGCVIDVVDAWAAEHDLHLAVLEEETLAMMRTQDWATP